MGQRKLRISNKAIVLMKLGSALGLFFSCCLFIFMNFHVLKQDLGLDEELPLGSAANPWGNVLFPIIFFLGLAFMIYYITNMIVRFETKEIWKADRLFILYQIVFLLIMVTTIWRWFFISITNALVPSVVMIISGLVNLFTPRIVDNNNTDF